MSKKYLSVAFAYVGVIIGAGLASGQDLLQYFLSFGAKGLIGIAVLGVLNVVFGVVAVGYAASLMGFKKLIGGMYPIIGWLGVALLVVLAVGWLRERPAVLREENLRRKLIRVLVRKHADDLEYTDEHRARPEPSPRPRSLTAPSCAALPTRSPSRSPTLRTMLPPTRARLCPSTRPWSSRRSRPTGRTAESAGRRGRGRLVRKQPGFRVRSGRVAAGAAGRHDPVAGADEQQGVTPHRSADRLGRRGQACALQGGRNLPVRARRAVGDSVHRLPHALLEVRARGRDGDANGGGGLAREVSVEPRRRRS